MKKPALLIVVLIGCVACSATTHSPSDPRLYFQLGETAGVTVIVDNLLYEIAEDDRILHHFEDADIERFREKLIEQLCQLSGGPCEYTGDSMEESHRGLDLTQADFNRLVDALIRAMEYAEVPVGVQNQLLARLTPLFGDIVGQ